MPGNPRSERGECSHDHSRRSGRRGRGRGEGVRRGKGGRRQGGGPVHRRPHLGRHDRRRRGGARSQEEEGGREEKQEVPAQLPPAHHLRLWRRRRVPSGLGHCEDRHGRRAHPGWSRRHQEHRHLRGQARLGVDGPPGWQHLDGRRDLHLGHQRQDMHGEAQERAHQRGQRHGPLPLRHQALHGRRSRRPHHEGVGPEDYEEGQERRVPRGQGPRPRHPHNPQRRLPDQREQGQHGRPHRRHQERRHSQQARR
mmetsp:Transcript_7647/g.15232  ORF Transcript_7647/g.15232 Transcript_7647/m.15232 type:complete len:253 (-) Transcript_7647:970-1728(-)